CPRSYCWVSRGAADGRRQPCGASEILVSGFPSVWQYVVTESRVAEISTLVGSAPLLSLSILLTSSFCFFSSCVVKSLHLVSPPVLMTSEAEHALDSKTEIAIVAAARYFIICPPGCELWYQYTKSHDFKPRRSHQLAQRLDELDPLGRRRRHRRHVQRGHPRLTEGRQTFLDEPPGTDQVDVAHQIVGDHLGGTVFVT